MAKTLTPNYALGKWDLGDNPGNVDLNANWTTIDTSMRGTDLLQQTYEAEEQMDVNQLAAASTNVTAINKWSRQMSLQANNVGGAALAFVGWSNVTAPGAATWAPDADGGWLAYATSTVLNNNLGHEFSVGNGTLLRPNMVPSVYIKVRTGALATDVQNVRIWLCVYDGAGGGIATTAAPTARMFGFRFDTGAGDASWVAYTADGTAGQISSLPGVNLTADTVYKLGLVFTDAATMQVYVNDSLIRTVTARIPDSSADMTWFMSVTNLNAGTARTLKFEKLTATMN